MASTDIGVRCQPAAQGGKLVIIGRMAYIYLSMALFPLQNAIESNKLSQSPMVQFNRVTITRLLKF